MISAAMAEYSIDTVLTASAWLAHMCHESSEGRLLEEVASGDAYEGNRLLGNHKGKGFGRRYKGRGHMQHTGHDNYEWLKIELGIDLLLYPELLSQPLISLRAAGAFWRRGAGLRLSRLAKARCGVGCDLNEVAARPDFEATCLAINGGWNGLAERQRYYRRWLEVLGRDAPLLARP